MGTGERFSIGDLHESLRERAGKVLGVIAAAALVVSGCAAPTTETKPATAASQEQAESAGDPTPNLDWKVVDWGCRNNSDCELGEWPDAIIAKTCDGTTLLYRYSDYFYQGGLTAVPNSPECTDSPAPESSSTPAATAPTSIG